jgi:hypothetical protein
MPTNEAGREIKMFEREFTHEHERDLTPAEKEQIKLMRAEHLIEQDDCFLKKFHEKFIAGGEICIACDFGSK